MYAISNAIKMNTGTEICGGRCDPNKKKSDK